MQNIVNFHSNTGYEAYTTEKVNKMPHGDKEGAKIYLKKYLLNESSYQNTWKHIYNSIFYSTKQLPEMIFKKDFSYIVLLGGAMFEEKDFGQFKDCLKKIDDKDFLIIQDTLNLSEKQKQYALKLKYPSNIEWSEIMSGNFISTILFDAYPSDYYLLGRSGLWGMFVANNYINESVNLAGTPIRIIGFDPKYQIIFRESFNIPKDTNYESLDYITQEDRPNLRDWIPAVYRL